MKPFPLFLGTLLLASTAGADHHDDREPPGGARVVVYQDAEYRGDFLVLRPGDAIENLSGRVFQNGARLNDSISSIRVEGDLEVYAYADSRYRGDALRVTENVRDLTGRLMAGGGFASWNDRISSLRVERIREPGREAGRPGEAARGNPEKIVQQAFLDILGRAPSSSESRDFQARMRDQGWTDRMLRDHLRQEDRYRMEAADRMVRQAYLEVLGRAADESGLRTYRRNLLERGWTEGDVRDDLRKSAEYRSKVRH